jgi:hypothetical protein
MRFGSVAQTSRAKSPAIGFSITLTADPDKIIAAVRRGHQVLDLMRFRATALRRTDRSLDQISASGRGPMGVEQAIADLAARRVERMAC